MSYIKVEQPSSARELADYYAFRWQLLRAPWQQPRGSEKDEYEASAFHRMICDKNRSLVAIGRLHIVDKEVAQIRYMAVLPEMRGQGFGSRILEELESIASGCNITTVLLNARDSAIGFYLQHGYRVTGEAHSLFDVIPHHKMEKQIGA